MTEQDIAKLKAAGFSDADIKDYMATEPGAGGTAPASAPVENLPEIDVTKPSTILSQAQAQGIPTTNEGSVATDIAALGAAAAPYAVPAAATAAGIYGAAKIGGWGRDMLSTAREGMEAYRHGVNTANEIAQRNAALQEARIAERVARGGQAAGQAVQAGEQAGSRAFQQMGQQLAKPIAPTGAVPTGPVAPAAAPAAPAPVAQPAAQPSLIDRTTAMIRQLAANKVLNTVAKGGLGIAAALTPGNVGQNYPFPTSGPYKGMEINPRTGRPWTPQELAQYK